MNEGGNEYLLQTAAHYPREFLYALQAMIEHREPAGAMAVAGALCAAGHTARVWRCYLRLYFRFGHGVRYPHLLQNIVLMQRDAPERPQRHAVVIDILVRAKRDPLVLQTVFQIADRLDRPPAAGDHVFASMHMLCTPEWMGEWSRLLGACSNHSGMLPVVGPVMLDLLRAWREAGGPWHLGPWKYVAATLGAFMHLRRPCGYTYSTEYIAPADPPKEWPPAIPPDEWPAYCVYPAHRRPAFGWRRWARREPRGVSERVGAECLPGVAASSASIARARLSMRAVTGLPGCLGLHTDEICGFTTNPAMHLCPSRTSGVIQSRGLGALEEFAWVSLVRMNDEEEARDAEESYRRAREFFAGARSAFTVLPVVRKGMFLVAAFVLESCIRPAGPAFFEMARVLEPYTALPVHAGLFIADETGHTICIPFGGTQAPAPLGPETAKHAEAREIVQKALGKINVI